MSERVLDIEPTAFSLDDFACGGAYPTGPRAVRVLLANRSDEPMVGTDMTVQIDRRPVPTGTLGAAPGGDPSPYYLLSFDLSKDNPVAQLVKDDCKPAGPFFHRYAFDVGLPQPVIQPVVPAVRRPWQTAAVPPRRR